jgi:hypothetical protein
MTATVGLAWLLASSKGPSAGVEIQRTAPVRLSKAM